MVLFRFFVKDATLSLPTLIWIAAVAGISNVAILGILNSAAEKVSAGGRGVWYLALFLIAIALYSLTQRQVMASTTNEVEKIIRKHRLDITDLIRRCDLASLEQVGRANIYAAVTRETLTISQTAGPLVMAFQSSVLTVFALAYLAWLTVPGFILTVLLAGVAIRVYLARAAEFNRYYHAAALHENHLFDRLTDLLDGFKEVRLNRYRSADLADHIQAISDAVTELKTKSNHGFVGSFILAQTTFYLLAAALVFLLPGISMTYADELLKTTTVILFLIGPVSTAVGSVSALATANAACENVLTLEERLRAVIKPVVGFEQERIDFAQITLQSLTYEHRDEHGQIVFSVGPLNLTIHKGEILFISGGNGAGKSTLLKLVTALYLPKTGLLKADDTVINEGNRSAYQNLFAVVFSDFHLFTRTYGLSGIDPQELQRLLEQMEIAGKTRLLGNEFETLNLSTGQRKRLALVVSLLEDRPIYIFDEWSADQDPHFRKKFHDEILPALKRHGKTIIAVTHDDRYFDRCDRRAVMEDGQITRIVTGPHHA